MDFHPRTFIDDAKAKTGISAIHDDSFMEGLEVYCAALNACSVLNDVGAATAAGLIALNLENRLKVDAYWAVHPELEEQVIDAPLIVTGMFRTGTTLTVDLIARDPEMRPLYGWEVDDSVPPPVLSAMRDDPRFQRRMEKMAAGDTIMIKDMHWEEADDPTECVFLLAQDFKSAQLEAIAPLPGYSDWLAKTDFSSAYAYHKRALQLLQSKSSGRWVLKAPNHAPHIDLVMQTYPDAQIAINHRDPATVIASTLSIFRGLYHNHCTAVDLDYIKDLYVPTAHGLAMALIDYRKAHPQCRFYDIAYKALKADKIAAISALYTHFGLPLTDEARAAMQRFLKRQDHASGAHSYDLETYGLTPGDIQSLFQDYTDFYGSQP